MKLARLTSLLVALPAAASAQFVYTAGDVHPTHVGSALVVIDDLDGDGVSDWLVGEPNHGPVGEYRGRVQARSGATGALIFAVIGEPDAYLGLSLATVGDLDGDGLTDFAIGSPYDSRGLPYAGRLTLHSGADGALLADLGSPTTEDQLGWAVAGLGDVDGDAVTDVAASSLREHSFTFDTGAVRVFSGATGAVLWTVLGGQANDNFGVSLTAVADRNGDGVQELLVGDVYQEPEGLHILSGADGTSLGQFLAPDLFQGDGFGRRVAVVGDQDGDGVEDLLLGVSSADLNGHLSGLARLISGSTGVTLRQWTGFATEDRLGQAVGSLSDRDGDGRRELVLGAYDAYLGADGCGYVQVRSSRDGSLLRLWPGTEGQRLGVGVAALPDLDGDGHEELLALSGGFSPQAGAAVLASAQRPIPGYCFADASLACPCGPAPPQDLPGGCPHSSNRGARLDAFGSRSLAADDLRFVVTHLHTLTTSILIAGTSSQQVPLHNGVLCVGGSLKRFPPQFSTIITSISYGPGLPANLAPQPGSTTYFQAWSRDHQNPCGGASNLSNAVSVTWLP